METINKSVKINASVGKVFRVVTDPENWTRYVTSLVAVTHLSKDAPAMGSTFRWEYKMMGIRLKGKGEATIKEGYDFIKNEDGTATLRINIEHDLPSALLNKIMDTALIRKLNNIESGHVLKKIKVMCEA